MGIGKVFDERHSELWVTALGQGVCIRLATRRRKTERKEKEEGKSEDANSTGGVCARHDESRQIKGNTETI